MLTTAEEQKGITYYHVADPSYQVGDDLLCYDELERQGQAPKWKWEEAEPGFDGDVICLFGTREEADQFIAEYQPNGILLEVTIPLNYRDWGILMGSTGEGYVAVYNKIEAEHIRSA